MKKKLWFWICMIETGIILIGGCILLFTTPSVTYEGEMDIRAYLDDFSEDNNDYPELGYIPDAKTAATVGGAVIDQLTGKHLFGAVTVSYDPEARLWLVHKGYFPHAGGFVVIEQDSGRIIKALLCK